MLLRANEQGLEEPPVTSTFIDFLYLFGHFAGEDLEEDTEEELEAIDEEAPLYTPAIRSSATGSQGILKRDTAPRIPTAGRSTRNLIEVLESPVRLRREDATETTPLISDSTLHRRSSRRSLSRQRRSRRGSVGQRGDATVSQTILMA